MPNPEKVSGFDPITAPNANSVLMIITWPFGASSSKRVTLSDFFANIPSSVNVNGDLSISGNSSLQVVTANTISSNAVTTETLTVLTNSIIIANTFTPANSSVIANAGMIFYDSNYLYVTTATGVTKRVALGTF